MTNYERIKAMSVDEMAMFLSNKMNCIVYPSYESNLCRGCRNYTKMSCIENYKQWLESEEEND